ncbi:MAG: ATP-binding protein [Actinomycetota bacterium]
MRRFEVMVPTAYAGVAVVWILGSDLLVQRLFPDHMMQAQMWKGWAFVGVTAVLLYLALRRIVAAQRRATASLREAARHLEQTKRDYQVIIDNMPDLFFRTSGDGRFQMVSAMGSEMLGYSNAEFMKLNIRDLCWTPEDRARLVEAMSRAEGRRVAVDIRLKRKDGVAIWAALNVIPRFVAGRALVIDAIARNMTAAVEATAELKMAKQGAEAASIAKSRFLAAASHDLRQPVQSLYLFAGVLDQQLAGSRSRKLVGDMLHALDAMKLLLDGLLDMSKLDAGLVVPQFEDVAVGPLLARLAEEYGGRARRLGLDFRWVPSTAVVRSDPVLLERMLRSLLDNALRFTPFGRVLLGCRRRNGRMDVQVIDTGIGIAPEQQASIFEEFHQLANPERDRSKGLGLGLAIVSRLGRLLGHGVDLRSAPARGSAFTVSLPRVAGAVAGESTAQAPAPERIGGTVVVIEDEPLVRLGFQTMLEGWGFHVLAGATAEEALEEIDRTGHHPDLVIADYRLPNNAVGTEAIRAVLQHCGAHAPGLIVTGDTAPQRLREAKASGYELLHKPVAAEELRKVVNTLLAA